MIKSTRINRLAAEWIFGASLLIYLVLRTLKHQTSVLHVKGR